MGRLKSRPTGTHPTMDDKAPNLKAAQSILGYSFRNKELLREALEPRGPWNGRQHSEGNVPLAQVGYAALSLAAVVQGYRAGMGKSRMANVRAAMISAGKLQEVCKKSKLLYCVSRRAQAAMRLYAC